MLRIRVTANNLEGPLPVEWGQLRWLYWLTLYGNHLTGPLPRSLSGLEILALFYFHDTELCAPLDSDFQEWLRGVGDVRGRNC